MAIQALSRTFKFNGNELADPNPKWTHTEVKNFYANEHSELTNSAIDVTMIDGKEVVEFKTNLGTKG